MTSLWLKQNSFLAGHLGTVRSKELLESNEVFKEDMLYVLVSVLFKLSHLTCYQVSSQV